MRTGDAGLRLIVYTGKEESVREDGAGTGPGVLWEARDGITGQ